MAEESSPRKHSESSASKLLRNAPVDLLGGILVNSIVSTNKSTPDPNTNNQQLASKKNSARDKPALSVPITTLNFKNFVSKCGPVFAVQEAVEAVIAWENPSKTIAFACMWAWLALNPVYFILLPNIVLISILLSTHTQRYPNGTGDDLGTDPISGHHILDDPIEGSPDESQHPHLLLVDVSARLEPRQLNQKKFSARVSPDEHTKFNGRLLSTIGSTLIVPLIPWRFLLLLGGETVFILNHPYVQVWLAQLKSASTSSV
ncbi:hypothetical protein PSTG_16569 [Puccinia striiformis f. sp. tritici PST-78]|uniref:TECPR1-like DysF domain-containing protein n=1 Tax=Puccinia striiformis f. sp. tritici PST-78 TaxID=1165861 RepID=A0A0L0USN1_9BASI|nr:hypothetical protein PSTG_16569 [Puccinia striiformis f. sp. tritici PST-78]